MGCHDTGKRMLHSFVQERLICEQDQETSKEFFDPLSRINIKIMKSLKSTVKAKSKDLQINGEEMYLRLLAIKYFYKCTSLHSLQYVHSRLENGTN